jgi:hypothetical protein
MAPKLPMWAEREIAQLIDIVKYSERTWITQKGRAVPYKHGVDMAQQQATQLYRAPHLVERGARIVAVVFRLAATQRACPCSPEFNTN